MTREDRQPSLVSLVPMAGALAALYASGLYSYLLFHSLVELATISVALTLLTLAWHSRRFLAGSSLTVLSLGYGLVAIIDLLHSLAYSGMGVFPGSDANLPTQLWIAARYLQAAVLCIAPLFAGRRVNDALVLWVTGGAVGGAIAWVYSGAFPDCYLPGTGLTRFKIVSEYIICGLLVAALALFRARRSVFAPRVFVLLACSVVCTIGSELAFTSYLSVFGPANMVGHVLKFVAFYLLYLAVVVTGLQQPLALIFRDLERANEELERRVAERTADLQASEQRFRSLIRKVRTAIVVHDGEGRLLDSNPLANELLGLSAEEIQGKQTSDAAWRFVRQDGSPLPLAEYPAELVLASRQPLRDYVAGIRRRGRPDATWVLVNAEPECDEAGSVTRVLVSFVDVTERKNAQERLQASEARLRNLSGELERRVCERTAELAAAN